MKKILVIILGVILFTSCAEPLENYKGYIVAKKYFIKELRKKYGSISKLIKRNKK